MALRTNPTVMTWPLCVRMRGHTQHDPSTWPVRHRWWDARMGLSSPLPPLVGGPWSCNAARGTLLRDTFSAIDNYITQTSPQAKYLPRQPLHTSYWMLGESTKAP